jgi:hypothetical protein
VGIGLGLFLGVHIYECAHIVFGIARIYECSLYHVAFCLPLAFLTLLGSWLVLVLRSQVVYMADHDKPCATGRRWHGWEVGGREPLDNAGVKSWDWAWERHFTNLWTSIKMI